MRAATVNAAPPSVGEMPLIRTEVMCPWDVYAVRAVAASCAESVSEAAFAVSPAAHDVRKACAVSAICRPDGCPAADRSVPYAVPDVAADVAAAEPL